MYLSRIKLKPGRENLIKYALVWGKSIYSEHKLIWDFFPEEKDAVRDFLYRRIDDSTLPTYYLLSGRKPELNDDIWSLETKGYNPEIRKGDMMRFSLRVNPVVTRKVSDSEPRKRKRDDVYMDALAEYKKIPDAERPSNNEILADSGLKWLNTRAEDYGFTVNDNDVIVEGYQRFEGTRDKGKQKIQFGVIDYTGILEVKDSDVFIKKTLKQGVGKAKAFGCGLMLVRRI